jgi:NADPH:quinone reductase-like Zn-dependent oxidoreductase
MKAIVQDGAAWAQLKEIDEPAVADGEVLVRVRAAAVNALDWHTLNGGRLVRAIAFLLRVPWSPVRGVDLAGRVESVGRNVTRFHAGDEVFGYAPGAFAEYASAKEDMLAPRPPELTFEEAAAIPIAGVTALQGLRDKAHLQPGQSVLVYGAGGGVGTFAVQVAKALGARVTAATSARNFEQVRACGPDELVDFVEEDITRRAQRYDVVFDVAATRPLGDLCRILAPRGTLVLAGAAKGNILVLLSRLTQALALSLFGRQRIVTYIAKVAQRDLVALKDFAETGKLKPVIDRRYPLAEAIDAIRYLGTGQARAKVVIDVG